MPPRDVPLVDGNAQQADAPAIVCRLACAICHVLKAKHALGAVSLDIVGRIVRTLR